MPPNRPQTLVAVVVTFNRLEKLQVTVRRLLESPPDALTALVVVDNASSDGTRDWLDGLGDPRLVVERAPRNEGGAGGFERGMRAATERFDPDWLLLMDDDGRPEPDTLSRFHELDKSGWHALAAAVYFPDGVICEMNRPSRNPFWHARAFWASAFKGRAGFHLRSDDYERDHILKIDVTSFVGFFISRAGIEAAGLPDPSLFVYGDDGIYTLGLSKAGGRIGFAPMLRFEHDLSTFEGQRGRFQPLWKAYFYHRNLLMLYRLASGRWFVPVLLVILPKWFLKTRDHSGERRRFLGLMARAVRDGIWRDTEATLEDAKRWAGDT